ncbi:hypothetical protein JZ751_015826 [Albula glossodonta]|uniref:EF-hand domain-containing protein n=1 Tax=Albula glossodonta TaxID=121402 RepID=A0A8T2MJ35_9TELE|nr:hypothetical protein JZ751_015826 [Albula glossodonta]
MLVEKIMNDLDSNKDNEVDFNEFVVLVAALTVITKRRPVARGSVTKRRPVARGSVTKRRPVARGSVTKRRPVARGSVTKRRPVARGSVTKRRPVARGSVTKRRPVARGSVTKRRPVARGSVTKRRPVARGSVTKRRFRLRRQVYRKISSRVSWINKYRIHSDRPVKLQSVLKAVGLTLHNHVVFVFPASIAQWYWRPPLPLEEAAPTVTEFTLGILGCLLLFDFQYYLWHLAHHRSQWLYVTFHAIHHEYPQPFCWVTQYMSAWELVSVGFWTTVDPVLLRCHTLTGYAFMVFNIWVSVDDHSGYDFPWSLHNLVPFGLWGGSVKHDTHHQRPKTNFQPFFSHWDWLCGTSSQHCHSPAMVAKVRRTVSHQPTNPEDRRSVTEAETSLHALAAVLIADSIRVDARVGEEIVTIQPLNDRLSAALRLTESALGDAPSGNGTALGDAPSGNGTALGDAPSGNGTALGDAPSGNGTALGDAPSGNGTALGDAPSGNGTALGDAPSGNGTALGDAPSGNGTALGDAPSGNGTALGDAPAGNATA